MTKTVCDFCGAEMQRVWDGITYSSPVKAENNSGRIEIDHFDGRRNKRYDVCPKCLAKIEDALAAGIWTSEG